MSHGSGHLHALAPRSSLYQGPFGRLFPELEPWDGPSLNDEDAFKDIANQKMVERPNKTPSELTDAASINSLEAEFSSNIPAGYTYFGQFIDHDITFDPASSRVRQNDPNGLTNFRTPRLDLDNLYGRGADDQPYLFNPDDKAKFAIGAMSDNANVADLPRLNGVAVIGDMRNDENAIVSQIQLAFLMAHNALVDRIRAQNPDLKTKTPANIKTAREMARKTLTWLYQHIVWQDYIPRIVINEVHACALSLEENVCGGRKVWRCGLDEIFRWKHQPYMPVEFSVAAFRFGHSMVRNAYQTNFPHRGFQDPATGDRIFVPIFDNSGGASPDDLRGFRAMEAKNAIQWDWFLPMGNAAPFFPQMARKIDISLSNALLFLPEDTSDVDSIENKLAARNLQRSVAFDLPSGTAVAKKLGVNPIALNADEPDALWYYVLREAKRNGGNTLGRVGSIIVSAVFAGLLKGDPSSYFVQEPGWTPDQDPLLEAGTDNTDTPGKWHLSSIIRLAGIDPAGVATTP